MFSFFKKKNEDDLTSFAELGCDMHSHLIPGIDDGAKELEESIQLIRGLQELGYRKLITTPHIQGDFFRNTPEIIGEGLQAVRAELARENLEVEMNAAAEYLIDDNFIRLLESGKPMLTLKDKLILVELSFAVPAMNLKEILFEVQLKGYQPVLAHPERYLYFGADKTWYDRLKDAGCYFQLNLLSIKGYYGKASQELAQYLIKKKYVDLLGTDLHHEKHLAHLHSSRITDTVKKLLDTGTIQNPFL